MSAGKLNRSGSGSVEVGDRTRPCRMFSEIGDMLGTGWTCKRGFRSIMVPVETFEGVSG